MMGITLSRTHVCMLATSAVDETLLGVIKLTMGIGVFAGGIDEGDFPDLQTYDGDWMAYECMVFQMPGVALQPMLPESASFVRADYRSMRKIDTGESPFLVAQIDVSRDIELDVVVSQLLLLP